MMCQLYPRIVCGLKPTLVRILIEIIPKRGTMKKIIPCALLFFLLAVTQGSDAQNREPKSLFRLYEDNDMINLRGKWTDEAYTAGLRLDLFFVKDHPSRFLLDKLMPKAGDSAVNIFQWGVMQVMYTPVDICTPDFQPYDYSYSAGLFAIHSLYSYNPEKKYSFQTELDAGVMGPPALGEEAQKLIHHIIHYYQPMGWNNQLKTDLLLNVHFSVEKQVASSGNFLEFIAGSKVSAGTMMNAVSVYPLIRIGKMNPYFEGFLKQFSEISGVKKRNRNKMQLYFIIKPELQWVLTNAMLEGGIFSSHSTLDDGKRDFYKSYRDLNHLVYSINYGAVLSCGHISVSVLQNSSSMLIKRTYNHDFGNISFYYNW